MRMKWKQSKKEGEDNELMELQSTKELAHGKRIFRGFCSLIEATCIVVEITVAEYRGDINVMVIEQSTSMLHLLLLASYENKIIFPSLLAFSLPIHFSIAFIYYRYNTHNCIER